MSADGPTSKKVLLMWKITAVACVILLTIGFGGSIASAVYLTQAANTCVAASLAALPRL
jgi:hypothetical protein